MLISTFWATSWQFFSPYREILQSTFYMPNFRSIGPFKQKLQNLPSPRHTNLQKARPVFGVNCFLQDDASDGIQSLQTSIEIKLCQTHGTDYTEIFSDILFRPVHGILDFITIYQSISVKCFGIPQCFTCMMILWFYAILHVFVLYSHYDYNISSKKLNAPRLWNLWASKEHSFFF